MKRIMAALACAILSFVAIGGAVSGQTSTTTITLTACGGGTQEVNQLQASEHFVPLGQATPSPAPSCNPNGSVAGFCPGNGTAQARACFFSGMGAPTFSAPNGSQYVRFDGSTGARVYYNTSGASTNGTTWTALSSP